MAARNRHADRPRGRTASPASLEWLTNIASHVPWHAARCAGGGRLFRKGTQKRRDARSTASVALFMAAPNPAAIQLFQRNLFSRIDLSGDGSVIKSKLEQAVSHARGGTLVTDALHWGSPWRLRAARPAATAPRTPSLFNADGSGPDDPPLQAPAVSVSGNSLRHCNRPARGNTTPDALLALVTASSTSSSGRTIGGGALQSGRSDPRLRALPEPAAATAGQQHRLDSGLSLLAEPVIVAAQQSERRRGADERQQYREPQRRAGPEQAGCEQAGAGAAGVPAAFGRDVEAQHAG